MDEKWKRRILHIRDREMWKRDKEVQKLVDKKWN